MTLPLLTLITGTNQTRLELHKQLSTILNGLVRIESSAADESNPETVTAGVVLFSSESLRKEYSHLAKGCKAVLTAQRTLHYQSLEKLFRLPQGEKILVVNDHNESAAELADLLIELGLNHLEYIPFHPKNKYHDDIKTAITPGEAAYVPSYIKNVTDIGVRLIDLSTFIRLLELLELDGLTGIISSRYAKNLITVAKKLHEAECEAEKTSRTLTHIVDHVEEGILAAGKDGRLLLFNKQLAEILGLKKTAAIGDSAENYLPVEVADFIFHSTMEKQFFSLHQNGYVVTRTYLEDGGAVASFSSVKKAIETEHTARKEIKQNGFIAKYTFDDIIGNHPKMLDARTIAGKLAGSLHPILIQGPTGSGKELFAQAIHLASACSKGPFVAVNCSAFSPTLLESELFGYEEAAFTGARKGGKKGIFEQADGGTIFLDEIGDIPRELQAALLRVLEEQEVRRVGGSKIIPVKTRILAATNSDLAKLAQQGSFRPDLYYRLNVLTLMVPSLDERKSDIPLLVQAFLNQSGKKVRMDDAVIKALRAIEWKGNVRELKNAVDYMLTVYDGVSIQLHDLPQTYISKGKEKKAKPQNEIELTVMDKREFHFILDTIKDCNEIGEPASRRIVAEKSKDSSTPLSNQQVRHRLDFLEKHHYVAKGRGRAGTKITSEGMDFLHSLSVNLQAIQRSE